MFRRQTSLLSAVFIALLLTLGVAPQFGIAQDQEQVELRVWDQFTDAAESEAVEAIYDGFEEQHPNITIAREAVQNEQMRQTVNTALASGTGPDVIFYDAGPGYAGVLAEAGLIMPLEDLAAEYGWRDRIAESALQGATLGGQLYGLPLQVDLIGMYYNRTLLEQEGLAVPETVGELITFCQEASEKGYIPLAFTNNPGWQGFHQFAMVANNMIGPEAMEQLLFENEGSWNTPEMVTAIETFFVELRDAGCFSPDVNALTNDDAAALFHSGQALMYPTGTWMVNGFADAMPDYEVGMVPFPALETGEGSFWVSGVGCRPTSSPNRLSTKRLRPCSSTTSSHRRRPSAGRRKPASSFPWR